MRTVNNYNWKVIFKEGGLSFGADFARENLKKLTQMIGLTIVGENAYTFHPGIGHSGVFLLSTSHLAWHTYPEYDFMTLDVNTCGGAIDEKLVEDFLIENFGCICAHLNKSVFV